LDQPLARGVERDNAAAARVNGEFLNDLTT
jgi:hypothetical protein